MRRIVRRRRAHESVADVPRCHRIQQPPWILRHCVRTFAQRYCRALPGQRRIKHHQIREPDTDTAQSHRETGRLVLRQDKRGASLRQPRAQPIDTDLAEHGNRRNIERQLQRAANGDGALERQIEIFRSVVAETRGLVVDQRLGVDETVFEPSP